MEREVLDRLLGWVETVTSAVKTTDAKASETARLTAEFIQLSTEALSRLQARFAELEEFFQVTTEALSRLQARFAELEEFFQVTTEALSRHQARFAELEERLRVLEALLEPEPSGESGALDVVALQAEVVRLREALEGLAATSYTDPWRVGVESREDGRVAIKSGIYTVLTVGDYFDGGSDEQEAALEAICAVVNAGVVSSAPTQSVPPGAALKEDTR